MYMYEVLVVVSNSVVTVYIIYTVLYMYMYMYTLCTIGLAEYNPPHENSVLGIKVYRYIHTLYMTL